jgi:carboxyl-terminal processing protease
MKKLLFPLVFMLLGSASLFAAKDNSKFELSKNLDIYNSVFQQLYLNYVDTLNVEKTVRTSIDGMLGKLDPYTNYIPESEKEDFRLMMTGEYGGVGAIISQRDKQIIIAEPYEGMPADKAGVKAGDVILEIDGVKMKDKTVEDASGMLKGTPKTTVKVTLQREEKTLKKEIVRKQIKTNPVVYAGTVGKGIGYIYLSGFTRDSSSKELRRALLALQKNDSIRSLVLDLRNNPGGDLQEAVDICNLFVPRGIEVVSTKGKNKQDNSVFKTKNNPLDASIPMAILINNGSASASEIVAGALQDLDRAVIVGSRSFGKGLVQSTKAVGYDGLLKITTAHYYIPSGRCVQAIDYKHRNKDGSVAAIPDSLTKEFKTAGGRTVRDGGGIKPDIEVKMPEEINISYRLMADNWIFNYATIYCQKHSQIPPIEDFALTDADFEEFKNYLKENKFTYELRSADLLKNLQETAKIEGYEERSAEAMKALKAALQPDTDKDLDFFRKDIVEMLSIEIVKRYYYQKGAVIEMLKHDKVSKRAIEILQNETEYRKILSASPTSI